MTASLAHIAIGDKVLVTTDAWFFGPDGRQYKSIWGTVKSLATDEQSLGIKTNMRSTNWYMIVGDVLIAGCQVHYVVKCKNPPPSVIKDFAIKDGEVIHYEQPTHTLNADTVN